MRCSPDRSLLTLILEGYFVARIERFRELVKGPLDAEHLRQKASEGWKLIGIECQWERQVTESVASQPHNMQQQELASGTVAEVPFGFQVASDCMHLAENSEEMQVLSFLMELVVQDFSLHRMAEELNRRAFRTRDGSAWSAVAVFKVFPRLVEAGSRIFPSEEWAARRKQVSRVPWNS